ncbi:formyltransferase family protein [Pseudodesulfovibrio sp.]|nr:formyltransferase family protein [Pseudodesulfovibrio sp.]
MFGVITYNTPHLKTEQLVKGLIGRGEEIGTLYALPFVPRPGREVVLNHRPDQSAGAHPRDMADKHGIRYVIPDNAATLSIHESLAIVAIGVIIPESVLADTAVINCHPGLIPEVRGLDAFKWAIHAGQPLGTTLHYIDRHVDCGEIIYREKTPVRPGDTIEQLAARHYEQEMKLNINFRDYLPGLGQVLDHDGQPSNRRMPIAIEQEMLDRFPDYVNMFASQPCGQEA